MWFQNKETGLKWEITDPALLERILRNENYERLEVSTSVTEEKKKSQPRKQVKA